jgi:uncharacterized protein (DUF433 family)
VEQDAFASWLLEKLTSERRWEETLSKSHGLVAERADEALEDHRAAMANCRRVIERSDEILGGSPGFGGTRVPVQSLIDYLEAGDRIDEFLDDFPTVTREQSVAAQVEPRGTGSLVVVLLVSHTSRYEGLKPAFRGYSRR